MQKAQEEVRMLQAAWHAKLLSQDREFMRKGFKFRDPMQDMHMASKSATSKLDELDKGEQKIVTTLKDFLPEAELNKVISWSRKANISIKTGTDPSALDNEIIQGDRIVEGIRRQYMKYCTDDSGDDGGYDETTRITSSSSTSKMNCDVAKQQQRRSLLISAPSKFQVHPRHGHSMSSSYTTSSTGSSSSHSSNDENKNNMIKNNGKKSSPNSSSSSSNNSHGESSSSENESEGSGNTSHGHHSHSSSSNSSSRNNESANDTTETDEDQQSKTQHPTGDPSTAHHEYYPPGYPCIPPNSAWWYNPSEPVQNGLMPTGYPTSSSWHHNQLRLQQHQREQYAMMSGMVMSGQGVPAAHPYANMGYGASSMYPSQMRGGYEYMPYHPYTMLPMRSPAEFPYGQTPVPQPHAPPHFSQQERVIRGAPTVATAAPPRVSNGQPVLAETSSESEPLKQSNSTTPRGGKINPLKRSLEHMDPSPFPPTFPTDPQQHSIASRLYYQNTHSHNGYNGFGECPPEKIYRSERYLHEASAGVYPAVPTTLPPTSAPPTAQVPFMEWRGIGDKRGLMVQRPVPSPMPIPVPMDYRMPYGHPGFYAMAPVAAGMPSQMMMNSSAVSSNSNSVGRNVRKGSSKAASATTSSSASTSDAAGSTSDASSSSAGEEPNKTPRESLKQPHSPTASSSSSSSVSQMADSDPNDITEEDQDTIGLGSEEKEKKHQGGGTSKSDNSSVTHHSKRALQGLMQLHTRDSVRDTIEGE